MEGRTADLLDGDLIRSLLDGFSDPAFLLDRERRIRQVNAACLRVLPVGEAAIGRHCHDVLHRDPVACVASESDCPLAECAARGRPVHRLHVHGGPGRTEHHHVRVLPVRRRDGHLIGFLQILQVLPVSSAEPDPRRLVGRSPAFLALLDELRRAGAHGLPVLLVGEAGTGRRLAAAALRELGDRRHGPLVTIETSGWTEAPGAAGPLSGAPALAAWTEHLAAVRGGTLVVHEIGDLPRLLQADLVERLGPAEAGDSSRAGAGGDFRLIATSSRDPAVLLRSGALLGELHERLAVAPIRVPALRDRMEDLPLLVDSLLERIAGAPGTEVAPEARDLLAAGRYPGNVAELLHRLERAFLLAEGGPLRAEHLSGGRWPLASMPEGPRAEAEILALAEVERRYLEWALAAFSGSRGELAAKLGVAERTLFRKLRRLKSRAPAEPV